jgi:excisionase family DNA binding protein
MNRKFFPKVNGYVVMEREILNPYQVSNLLGIPEHTVLKLARKGILPGRKAGRNWLFSKTHLIDWVRKDLKETEPGQ